MSRAPTGKDESKSSTENQPDILTRKKDACEVTTAFERDINYKIIDDNCWNDDVLKMNLTMSPRKRDVEKMR